MSSIYYLCFWKVMPQIHTKEKAHGMSSRKKSQMHTKSKVFFFYFLSENESGSVQHSFEIRSHVGYQKNMDLIL